MKSQKCLDPNTHILMFDSTRKYVKDIIQGDKIMGVDSTCVTVLSILTGEDEMFKIIPIKGKEYIVNKDYILSLKSSANPTLYWRKDRNSYQLKWIDCAKANYMTFNCRDFESKEDAFNNGLKKKEEIGRLNGKISNISVKDYLLIPITHVRNNLKGYKIGLSYPHKNVEIDPYLIGYWLGDGDSSGSKITTADLEIVEYFRKEVSKYNLYVNKIGNSKYAYGITNPENRGIKKSNYFLEKLKDNNLIFNKHIPMIFLQNSESVRLKLLAGLIDSDGYFGNGVYEIVQKSEKLSRDIVFLCRSLGFYTSVKKCEKTCANGKNGPVTGEYFRMLFSGEGLENIPVILERKKAGPRKQIKNALVTGISIISEGKKRCKNLVLDKKNILLSDFTVI